MTINQDKLNKSLVWYHTFFIKDGKLVHEEEDADIKLYGVWCHNAAADTIKSNMSEIAGSSFADVGTCGGWFSHVFSGLGADVDAIDMLDRPPRRIAQEIIGSEYSFINENIYQLNTLGKKYDYVWSQDVFCHLEHPLLALRVLRDICTKKVFIGTDRTVAHVSEIDFQNRWPDVNTNSVCHYHNDMYTFSYNDKFMETMLINCGFKNPIIKFSYRTLAGKRHYRFTGDEDLLTVGVANTAQQTRLGRTIDVWEADVDESKIAFPPFKQIDFTGSADFDDSVAADPPDERDHHI